MLGKPGGLSRMKGGGMAELTDGFPSFNAKLVSKRAAWTSAMQCDRIAP